MTTSPALERVPKHPGIYRRGNRYVAIARDHRGRQVKRFARTIAEAEDKKAEIRVAAARHEPQQRSRVTFEVYAREWLESYGGRTAKGIREETRADYRKRLEQDAIPFLGKLRLAEIEARDLDALAARVASRGVKPNTVRLALAPVKALLATAHQRGDLRANPAAGYRTRYELDTRSDDEEGGQEAKALTPEELAAFLDALQARDEWRRWRPFFEFLVQTGLRIGEAVEVRWGDVDLGQRTVKVSRRFYRGRVGPTKTKFGRRTVRIPVEVARQLWRREVDEHPDADALLFTNEQGGRVDQSNLMTRVLKPAAVAAGLGEWVKTPKGKRAESWVGFHSFRHTCASMLFRAGWTAPQVQRFLGHHKPSFTLDVYVHLMPEDVPEPPVMGNTGATRPAETVLEPVVLETAGAAS